MKPLDLLDLGGPRRTPLIQQSEASECGLACLAMVAGYHGFVTDMPTLRRQFGASLRGTTLMGLIRVTEQIGFSARPLRVDMEHLSQLALPAVLHWDLNHFVVLTKVSRGVRGTFYRVNDPARGEERIGEAEFSRHFTGVALELMKTEAFRPAVQRAALRISQLWSRISGLWTSLRQVLLLSIVLQLVALAAPFYLQLGVDTAFPSFDTGLLDMLALGFGGLMVISALTSWLRSLILTTLSSSLSYQVVVNLYRHLLRLPLRWFEKRHVGDILSRFGSTRPVSTLISQGLIAAVIDGAMSVTTLALMTVYSPLLSALAVGALLIVAALRASFIGILKARNISVVTANARESSAFIESVRGIAAIKAFGRETNRQRLWQQTKADAVNAEVKLGRMSGGFDAAAQFLLGAERILFVWLGLRLAMNGAFTVGMLFAFQSYKQQFLDSAIRLVEQAINYRMLDVHLGRIADIALSQPEEAENPIQPLAQTIDGAIELRNVHFRYAPGEPEILKGINLKISAGEMVALVGPSGGGKTTLMKIAMGLFDPSYGQVLVDGRFLAEVGLANWRRQIGSVAQDDMLYAGSLAENIAFFDPEIDMEQVVEAAKLAHVHDEIERMPMRYESLVGDMGSSLSGGQKQRVLLARALYRRPKVLFIDEGTAHLDCAAEAAVARSLEKLGITRIVIAHRPQATVGIRRKFLVTGGSCRDVSAPPIPVGGCA
jgi:ATP-binding cassette subfamily B protein RaxB